MLYPLSYGGDNRWELTWPTRQAHNVNFAFWQKCQNFAIRPVACLPWS